MPRRLPLLLLLAALLLPTAAAPADGRGGRGGGGGGGIGKHAVTASHAAGVWTIRGTDTRDAPAYRLDRERFVVDHANLTGAFCDEVLVRRGTPCGPGLPVCRTRIGPHVVCAGVPVTAVRYELRAGDDFMPGTDKRLPLVVVAGAGRDVVLGDQGDDRIEGGGGNDALQDQRPDLDGPTVADVDVLLGGAGDDELISHGGADRIDCGPGRDTVVAGPRARVENCEERG